jgi:hypothetical protein
LAPATNFVKEKKFILPYCIFNVLAMFVLLPDEFISLPASLIFLVMYLFACVEIIFLPNYIASIIGEKKGYLMQIIICSTAFILSNILVKNPTTVFFLICNIYITYYVCKYFIWLFKGDERFDLKKTNHYWIIMGISICYTGSIPYFIAELFILRFGKFELYNSLVQIIFSTYIVLNISMYLFFVKSFLCKKISQKYLSGQFLDHS